MLSLGVTLILLTGVYASLSVAVPGDASNIEALMRESTAALFPLFYDGRQTASALRHVAVVDPMLLEDGTYFLLQIDDELVACGGWSRRDRPYTGSGDSESDARPLDPEREPARVRAMFVSPHWTRRGLGRRILDECERAAAAEHFRELYLVATLAGLPLYRACGFRELEELDVTTPDSVTLRCVAMDKRIAPDA
jgi:GNAT superfamily N-acetyltransferase